MIGKLPVAVYSKFWKFFRLGAISSVLFLSSCATANLLGVATGLEFAVRHETHRIQSHGSFKSPANLTEITDVLNGYITNQNELALCLNAFLDPQFKTVQFHLKVPLSLSVKGRDFISSSVDNELVCVFSEEVTSKQCSSRRLDRQIPVVRVPTAIEVKEVQSETIYFIDDVPAIFYSSRSLETQNHRSVYLRFKQPTTTNKDGKSVFKKSATAAIPSALLLLPLTVALDALYVVAHGFAAGR